MSHDYFWLDAAQFARLEPLLPTDARGKPRVDDRRVTSGIVHALKSGGRWADAPDAYGSRPPARPLAGHSPGGRAGALQCLGRWRVPGSRGRAGR